MVIKLDFIKQTDDNISLCENVILELASWTGSFKIQCVEIVKLNNVETNCKLESYKIMMNLFLSLFLLLKN